MGKVSPWGLARVAATPGSNPLMLCGAQDPPHLIVSLLQGEATGSSGLHVPCKAASCGIVIYGSLLTPDSGSPHLGPPDLSS